MKRYSLKSKFFLVSTFITTFFAAAVFSQDDGYLLSGSYVLERGAGSDAEAVVASATSGRGITAAQRADLRSKLTIPPRIEIDVTGTTVSLRTGQGAAAVFEADGVARDSRSADGSPVSVRASFAGQVLIIASVGTNADFTITLTPLRGGRQMKVTRRVTAAYLDETVFAESVYQKQGFVENTARRKPVTTQPREVITDRDDRSQNRYPDDGDYTNSDGRDADDVSDSDSYGGYSDSEPVDIVPARRDDRRTRRNDRQPVRRDYPQPQTASRRRNSRYTNFVVPGGTVIQGRLENMVTTRASQENDRFRIIVESPSEFRGALVEGYLTGIERTGKVTGRSAVTFNFESIVLRDGRRYDFAGVLQQVVDRSGEEIRTNDEGEVTGKSRTKETVKRSGIGAGLGAIIGGILGGGKGALIGASIGAGAGAGSMIPGGRDDLEIEPGARLTIRSTGPGT